ncbi:MAG: hypothetical protein LBC39_06255 [Methanobrevibacter sp.]|jgi:uncharacterized membrane protein|nr:hypothetical protein [Candidatus Methanovirga aequatorialis]
MKEDIPINDIKRKISKTGIFVGILIILFALTWIAVELGLIPKVILNLWPQIILLIVGIFILYKAL